MNSTDTRTERTGPQQLTLLSESDQPAQLAASTAHARFRLSKQTRQRGLSHVAEIRRQLADAQARREAAATTPLPPRRAA